MTWPVMRLGGVRYDWAPEIRSANNPSPGFKAWSTRFQKGAPGSAALTDLEKLRRFRPGLFSDFREDILFACWCAKEYTSKSDTPDTVRRKLKEVWETEITEQLYYAREILGFYEIHRTEMNEAYESPLSDWIVAVPPLLNGLESALSEYVDYLRFHQTEKRADRRYWLACLDYGHPVQDRRTPNDEVRTGLAFELTLRFKHWTDIQQCPNPFDVLDKGLPRRGAPNYKLVARLLEAALHGRSIRIEDKLRKQAKKVEDDLRDLVKRHPDIKFIGWPILAP